MKQHMFIAARMAWSAAWSAYTARRWAVVADAILLAILVVLVL